MECFSDIGWGIMISALESTKTNINQSASLKLRSGCTFEYNMNRMVDNVVATGTEYTAPDGSKPFKKLFPIDSVIKPNRPLAAGIKYAISGDVAQNSYRNPKSISYPISYRTYYPGADTLYKYYVYATLPCYNIIIFWRRWEDVPLLYKRDDEIF